MSPQPTPNPVELHLLGLVPNILQHLESMCDYCTRNLNLLSYTRIAFHRPAAEEAAASQLLVLGAVRQEIDVRLAALASNYPVNHPEASNNSSHRPVGTHKSHTTQHTDTHAFRNTASDAPLENPASTRTLPPFKPETNDLPNKILTRIVQEATAFRFTTTDSRALRLAARSSAESSHVYRLISLSHVNRAWRAAVIHTWHFWSSIFPSQNTKLIKLCVDRATAEDRRIHITLDYHRLSSNPAILAQEEIAWLSALLPHAHRWGTLDFANVPQYHLSVHLWLVHHTPNLQNLIVRNLAPNHSTVFDPATLLFGGARPSLHTLALVRLDVPLATFDYSKLVEFVMQETLHTLEALFTVLHAARGLQVFKITRSSTQDNEGPTEHLESVKLLLTKLHLGNTKTPLLLLNCSLLTHLSLHDTTTTIPDVLKFLEYSPKLEYLSLVHTLPQQIVGDLVHQIACHIPVTLHHLDYLGVTMTHSLALGFLEKLRCPGLSYMHFQSFLDDQGTDYAPVVNVASAALSSLLSGPAALLARFAESQSSFAIWPSVPGDAPAATGLTIFLDHPSPRIQANPNAVGAPFKSLLHSLSPQVLEIIDCYEHRSRDEWALDMLALPSHLCPNICHIKANSESCIGEALARDPKLFPCVEMLVLGEAAARWAEQDELPPWMADLLVDRESCNFDFAYSRDLS